MINILININTYIFYNTYFQLVDSFIEKYVFNLFYN